VASGRGEDEGEREEEGERAEGARGGIRYPEGHWAAAMS
jgi:hypothetical protein